SLPSPSKSPEWMVTGSRGTSWIVSGPANVMRSAPGSKAGRTLAHRKAMSDARRMADPTFDYTPWFVLHRPGDLVQLGPDGLARTSRERASSYSRVTPWQSDGPHRVGWWRRITREGGP